MSKSTISTFQRFPDKESARLYFESRLWPVGPVCPVCESAERITARKAGYYRCLACAEDFTVRTGTVMERSHIPLHKWLYAMYLLVTARKGISSMQLAKEIGVTQKSAWFMLHRLRERGLMGVYHKVSVKHLGRYVDEFTFRLNEGNVKIHTLDRLDSFIDGMADKRLTYARLIQ
jgi:transposase-like protein